jgi:Zn-finger protein
MTEAEMWFGKYIEALNGRGIVMCRDCEYFNKHATSPIVHCVLGTKIPDRKGNGFCSNGKRKAVEDED